MVLPIALAAKFWCLGIKETMFGSHCENERATPVCQGLRATIAVCLFVRNARSAAISQMEPAEGGLATLRTQSGALGPANRLRLTTAWRSRQRSCSLAHSRPASLVSSALRSSWVQSLV